MPTLRVCRRPRDTVTRERAHEPLGWRPTTLLVTLASPKGLASRIGVAADLD
ncbi:hypothetical protein GCM10022226_77020 [Sphaerisporangium flaviroseum]|uniref:Uncharacterized protein n=1 Tax=Sphaerisporangium flaviroseum TaxID=509199 RepID=A0ABP7JEH0_9ACTN